MAEVTIRVRPRPQYLEQMPTLDRLTAERLPPPMRELAREKSIDLALELKLATPDARYWLCTAGIPEARPDVPRGWVTGHITPEYSRPDGIWEMDERAAYGPQNATWLQGNDYLQLLTDEYERLQQRHADSASWQVAQQMEVTQEEMRQVVTQMDAIVQQKQLQRPR
ncbi:MAG: hypothetical protein IT429_06600 [Gemmataceae bacterium]|nr:hypothetical protein [Gemmataceae bacterium]